MPVSDSMFDVLGEAGPFAAHIDSFSPRVAQQEMAEKIADTLINNDVLICEAGTGTGKTFAYLVPALLSDNRIIISTGTRNLQDQLFLRDLPVVAKILDVKRQCVMLKGRGNYICPYRLDQAGKQIAYHSRQQSDQIHRIGAWYNRSSDGDISGMRELPEDSPVWSHVTSTAENCLGQDCPDLSTCPVVKARRAAQTADVLVINHYLLFSDMLLRDQGFGELLPGADALIIDEAHQIPDIASDFFGQALSSRQLMELVNDSLTEYQHIAGDMPAFQDALTRLNRSISDLRTSLGNSQQRQQWRPILESKSAVDRLTCLQDELQYINHLLEKLAARSKGLDACWRRSSELLQRFNVFVNADNDAHICWYEVSRHGFILHETPIDIANAFQDKMKCYDTAWVFTSATLSVGNSFTHFTDRLGLQGAHTENWESPFNYMDNACLFLPSNMPEPSSPDFLNSMLRVSIPLIEAVQGRTFLLFTSHRALQQAAQYIKTFKLSYPLLVQGDAPRDELLQQFRELGNAVLLGTGSFWEGVDVQGPALSCVIIDKLPFATPGDPVFQARSELMIQKGGNPFRDFQLPNAVIALKQGVGRLIRDHCDTGVMMICDPRLTTKSYGQIFLKNLPSMRKIRKFDEIIDFIALNMTTVADKPRRSSSESR